MQNPEFVRLLEEFGHRWFRSADNRRFDLAVSYLIRVNDIRRDAEGSLPNGESEHEESEGPETTTVSNNTTHARE